LPFFVPPGRGGGGSLSQISRRKNLPAAIQKGNRKEANSFWRTFVIKEPFSFTTLVPVVNCRIDRDIIQHFLGLSIAV
jgi:hypothetical protein